MDSPRTKFAVCLAVTAFAGLGAYQVWQSRKRRQTVKDAVNNLVRLGQSSVMHEIICLSVQDTVLLWNRKTVVIACIILITCSLKSSNGYDILFG